MSAKSNSIKNKYQYIGILSKSVRLKENERWGMNDLDGNEILSSQYNEIFTLSSGIGLIAAREGSFWKIYNFSGEIINSEKYDFLYPYYGLFGITKIKKGNSYGLLNKKGRKILPTIYKKIEKFGSGIILHNFDSSKEFIERKQLMNLPEFTNESNLELIKEPVKKVLPIKIGNKSRSF
jgi:hypothetical protein